MKIRAIFLLSGVGFLIALGCAYLLARQGKPEAPVFPPSANPYAQGIYANGIIESDQTSGANIDVYPEVAGPVIQVLVTEGQVVAKGAPLLTIDDSVPRATAEQQSLQAEAARATLDELKAQPRKESLDVARAQLALAQANLKTAQDQYSKQKHLADINPTLVSKDVLDNAADAVKVNEANVALASRQYDLAKAGAWSFDVDSQDKQYRALAKAAQSSSATLAKYTLHAPSDGVVLALNTAVGSYVSSQGAYDTYTQGFGPIIVLGAPQSSLSVRCYIDEILINRLPSPQKMRAEMAVRGSSERIPLEFVRVQPYVSPKIELTDQREERVDQRVLPVVFRFTVTTKVKVYPGQLVDVYIGVQ
ncbi:MAG: biotin/lipoyl-binding protein [Rudaea sp.]|nr:biotin/lipoyl-binding protein [Rudaea sp.]